MRGCPLGVITTLRIGGGEVGAEQQDIAAAEGLPYSLYLTHFEVMRLLLDRAPTWGAFWTRMALSLPAVFLAGYLLYRIVEVPFMLYRDKHFPNV